MNIEAQESPFKEKALSSQNRGRYSRKLRMPHGSESAIRSQRKKMCSFALDEVPESGYPRTLVSLEFPGIFVDP